MRVSNGPTRSTQRGWLRLRPLFPRLLPTAYFRLPTHVASALVPAFFGIRVARPLTSAGIGPCLATAFVAIVMLSLSGCGAPDVPATAEEMESRMDRTEQQLRDSAGPTNSTVNGDS